MPWLFYLAVDIPPTATGSRRCLILKQFIADSADFRGSGRIGLIDTGEVPAVGGFDFAALGEGFYFGHELNRGRIF
jgi:hypothetical protein